jgi:ubiquinone/menaquinone biosynthesis C-methylase UbiE
MSEVLSAPSPDLVAIKGRQRTAWSAGDYAVVGTTLQIVGENLCEALDLRAGQKVLDVAAGNGNATLAAARRFCEVTSTDYVPALLESGRARAEAEDQEIVFKEADAENLPFPDASFDAVISTFGVMFTADQDKAAAELLRVCKPGGRIGLANWTPESFVGQMFRIIAKYIPSAPGLKPPALWGTRSRLEQLFGTSARTIGSKSRFFNFRYRSPEHFVEVFRSYYGPVNKTYAALDAAKQAALTSDLLALIALGNASGDATLVLPSAYLEVVIERK